MKDHKSLNIKNMKETMVNYSGEQKELEKIWDTFYQMQCMGFISRDTWVKLYEQCKGWYVTEDGSAVRDSEKDDALVWEYSSDATYVA